MVITYLNGRERGQSWRACSWGLKSNKSYYKLTLDFSHHKNMLWQIPVWLMYIRSRKICICLHVTLWRIIYNEYCYLHRKLICKAFVNKKKWCFLKTSKTPCFITDLLLCGCAQMLLFVHWCELHWFLQSCIVCISIACMMMAQSGPLGSQFLLWWVRFRNWASLPESLLCICGTLMIFSWGTVAFLCRLLLAQPEPLDEERSY